MLIQINKYTGYGIRFDSRSKCLFTYGSYLKNVILFGADMSSSVYVDNKRKDNFLIGKGPTQGLDDTTLIAEVSYLSILHYQEKDLY